MDEEVRGYERALLRSGTDPKKIGAALLGADLDRFWVLMRHTSTFPAGSLQGRQAVAVTGFMRVARVTHDFRGDFRAPIAAESGEAGVEEVPHSLWAFSVDTISELVALGDFFGARGVSYFLWDRKKCVQVTFYGFTTYERVVPGWRAEDVNRQLRGPEVEGPSEEERSVLATYVRARASSCLNMAPHAPHGECPGVTHMSVM